MTHCRIAVLVGFLLIESAAVTLSLAPIDPPGPQPGIELPALPVLAKEKSRLKFHARFEQTESIIKGDTFYYSSVPAPAKRTETRAFTILFDFDSSRLSEESKKILDSVAAIANSRQQIRIFATGHTDTSGPESYNQFLSRQRVETVLKAFVERGILAENIDNEAFGEKRLRVTTPDEAPDSRNRRVEIIVGPAPKI
jgi:outer membrane protein OmpA-like peptidoglycan-associated protein